MVVNNIFFKIKYNYWKKKDVFFSERRAKEIVMKAKKENERASQAVPETE